MTAIQRTETVTIGRPNIRGVELPIEGTAPYVQLRFSEKAKATMRANMLAGSTAKKGKNREPRDFDADYAVALYRFDDGGYGIPAAAFREAAISACRVAGFVMTRAKLSVFIEADGYDAADGTALVRIIEGEPEPAEHAVRNADGSADLRIRGMWRHWRALLTIRYDAGQFTQTDIINLFSIVGEQVGIGEGRADSKKSAGMGWGFFCIARKEA